MFSSQLIYIHIYQSASPEYHEDMVPQEKGSYSFVDSLSIIVFIISIILLLLQIIILSCGGARPFIIIYSY